MNLQAYSQAAGRDADALEQQQKVLELDEHQVVALVAMALIYADRGDLTQALDIARRAHAIAPWYPDAAAEFAALLRRNGRKRNRDPWCRLWAQARRSERRTSKRFFTCFAATLIREQIGRRNQLISVTWP
jgi:tetratricopeptide (TPR) repeat protein